MAYTITDNMRRVGWDTRLNDQARLIDPLTALSGIHRSRTTNFNSWLLKVKASQGESTRTLALLRDLVGEGVYGTESLLGREEKQATMEVQVFADELAHGVPIEQYGVETWEQSPWKVYAQAQPQLSVWHKQVQGRRMREAICEKYDYVLTGDKARDKKTPKVHSNIAVVKAATVTGVTYNSTESTYLGNIDTAVGTIATPTDLKFLDALSEWATQEKKIQPIVGDDGVAMYGLMIPTKTMTILRPLIRDLQKYTSYPALAGLDAVRFGNFIIMEDPRAPRVAVADTPTATFSYVGASDNRATAAAKTPDVGILLGREALVEYTLENLHFEHELQDYNRRKGIGAFRTDGYTRVEWEDDIKSPSKFMNQNSALVLFKST